ncbi:unnamed protein product [Brachionus calyciflorus]|uniref:Uncharacterized protein n=1 Tax=Brachionus calyciflorus TaxID=104777 RepID=A0A814IYI7_9BILA|nr:unnamed protein product [Brachionus calyciflorus]
MYSMRNDNFGQVNQEGISSTCKNSGVESLNEDNNSFSFVHLSKLAGAFTIFDYFTSNWPNKTTQEDVVQHVSEFATVEDIKELTAKYNYYKSFHVRVRSNFKEKMLDPSNWPLNIKNVKRGQNYSTRGSQRESTSYLVNYGTTSSGITAGFTGEKKRKSRVDSDSSSNDSVTEVATKKQLQIDNNQTLASQNEVEIIQDMQM